MLLPFVLQFEW